MANIEKVISDPSLLDDMRFTDYSWDGEKNFENTALGRVSLNDLVKEIEQAYITYLSSGKDKERAMLKLLVKRVSKISRQGGQQSLIQKGIFKVTRIARSAIQGDRGSSTEERLEHMAFLLQYSCERELCTTGVKKTLSPQVKEALNCSYDKYYSIPYKDNHIRQREAAWAIGDTVIHRYNHGLAHATRKAFVMPFIIDYLLRHGKDEIQANLRALIDQEGRDRVVEKLQIAIIFEVAGRESECGSCDNLKTYMGYLEGSSEALREHCRSAGLIGQDKLFSSQADVERYAMAIKESRSTPTALKTHVRWM